MRRFLILLLILNVYAAGYCQSKAPALLLGDFFNQLKAVGKVKHEVSHYEKFSGFDYNTFTPLNDSKMDSLYFEVGYDKKGSIVEIIHRTINNHSRFDYLLLVYEFPDYRILIMKRNFGGSTTFDYTSTAIFCSKNKQEYNYMISVVSQFQNQHIDHESYLDFPIAKFDAISCLMRLDRELYPEHAIRISSKKIISYSSIAYQSYNAHEIKTEVLQLFIDVQSHYPNLKEINEKALVDSIFREVDEIEPNWIMNLTPKLYGQKSVPLWLFNGAHLYESCTLK